MSPLEDLIARLGDEVEDPEEETFLLYAQDIPSQNLGFVNPRASTLEVTVGEREFTIVQSPTVLSSSRAGGTTGAVLWKITPIFAAWLSHPQNPLFTTSLLTPSSTILELGCGISPLNALALSHTRRISRYILTDQPYVQRFIQRNLDANPPPRRKTGPVSSPAVVQFRALDWETDAVTGTPEAPSFDAVLACDCVYNEALVAPLVQTCVDACRLRKTDAQKLAAPCVCVVAQQLRDDDVFLSWLRVFAAAFRVWRVPDEELPAELRPGAGFVVHVGVLKEDMA